MLKIANQADGPKIFWLNLLRRDLFLALIFILPLTSGAYASHARELCGSANGETTDTTPATHLCVKRATASAITDQSGNGSGPWVWSCTGGRTTSNCEAYSSISGGGYEPSGCQPGNHGLIRGRPRIQTINGAPVLVADDGCLIVAQDAWANTAGYEGSTYVSSSGFDTFSATSGVDLTWVQQVQSIVNANAIASSQVVIDPSQASTCLNGYPYALTLDQFVTTMQTLLSYANQTGVYLIIEPGICGQWGAAQGGPADANINLSFQTQMWTTLAQTFGQYTNVILEEVGETQGFGNNSDQLEGQMNDQDYLTIRQYAPDTMFLAWGDDGGTNPNWGSWADLTANAPDINYSNAASSWSSINTYDTSTIVAFIQQGEALGQAMWSNEGPEIAQNCAFGLDGGGLQAYIETLMSNNVGWQCDDGWPNPYGPEVPFWPQD